MMVLRIPGIYVVSVRSRLGGMGKYSCPWVRHGGLKSNATPDTGKSTCPCHPG